MQLAYYATMILSDGRKFIPYPMDKRHEKIRRVAKIMKVTGSNALFDLIGAQVMSPVSIRGRYSNHAVGVLIDLYRYSRNKSH